MLFLVHGIQGFKRQRVLHAFLFNGVSRQCRCSWALHTICKDWLPKGSDRVGLLWYPGGVALEEVACQLQVTGGLINCFSKVHEGLDLKSHTVNPNLQHICAGFQHVATNADRRMHHLSLCPRVAWNAGRHNVRVRMCRFGRRRGVPAGCVGRSFLHMAAQRLSGVAWNAFAHLSVISTIMPATHSSGRPSVTVMSEASQRPHFASCQWSSPKH